MASRPSGGFWIELLSKLRWKDSGEEFRWLDEHKDAMEQRVKESIECLEKGISPRSALLMPTKLTHRQIAIIVGVEESKVAETERDSRGPCRSDAS